MWLPVLWGGRGGSPLAWLFGCSGRVCFSRGGGGSPSAPFLDFLDVFFADTSKQHFEEPTVSRACQPQRGCPGLSYLPTSPHALSVWVTEGSLLPDPPSKAVEKRIFILHSALCFQQESSPGNVVGHEGRNGSYFLKNTVKSANICTLSIMTVLLPTAERGRPPWLANGRVKSSAVRPTVECGLQLHTSGEGRRASSSRCDQQLPRRSCVSPCLFPAVFEVLAI